MDPSPFDRQVGGDHYKTDGIQPIVFALSNNLGFVEANVVKYVTRWRRKGGLDDIRKAIHYLEALLEWEEAFENKQETDNNEHIEATNEEHSPLETPEQLSHPRYRRRFEIPQ